MSIGYWVVTLARTLLQGDHQGQLMAICTVAVQVVEPAVRLVELNKMELRNRRANLIAVK